MTAVNFGTMTKVNFKISPDNKTAQNLQAEYNKQFSIFDQAKKAEQSSSGGSDNNASNMSISPSDLKKATLDAQQKLLALQAALEKEVKNNPADGNDKSKDQNKVEGGNLSGMA